MEQINTHVAVSHKRKNLQDAALTNKKVVSDNTNTDGTHFNIFGSDSFGVVTANSAGLMSREILQVMSEYMYELADAYCRITTSDFHVQTQAADSAGQAAYNSSMDDAQKTQTQGWFSIASGGVQLAGAGASMYAGVKAGKKTAVEQEKLGNVKSNFSELQKADSSEFESAPLGGEETLSGDEIRAKLSSDKAKAHYDNVMNGTSEGAKFDGSAEHTEALDAIRSNDSLKSEAAKANRDAIRHKETTISGYQQEAGTITNMANMFSQFASSTTQGAGSVVVSRYDRDKAKQEMARAVLSPVQQQLGQMASTNNQKMDASQANAMEQLRNWYQMAQSTPVRG